MNRGLLTIYLLVILGIAGCASGKATYLNDGRSGYVVSCGGLWDEWSTCLVKAGKLCRQSGYDTVLSNQVESELVVACKTPR
jgi:hypothetical protein